MTAAQIRNLPAAVDLVTAARALGIGRTKAYQLARCGQFPCPIVRVGQTYLVPTAGLLTLLGLTPEATDQTTDEQAAPEGDV
jgi:hypothetical protein